MLNNAEDLTLFCRYMQRRNTSFHIIKSSFQNRASTKDICILLFAWLHPNTSSQVALGSIYSRGSFNRLANNSNNDPKLSHTSQPLNHLTRLKSGAEGKPQMWLTNL